MAAAKFAVAFGELERADVYQQAADEIRQGTDTYLWDREAERFVRMVNTQPDGTWEVDRTVDTSLAGLWQFGR